MLDIKPRYLKMLHEIFQQYAPDMQVLAYGSRVSGKAHAGSDLDLVVRNPQNLAAPQENFFELREAISDSNIPILVEILDWARIPDDFRKEIECANIIIWP